MPFKIHRINTDKGTTDIAAPQFATGEQALRAAMENAVQFIASHWDLDQGATKDGPADNKRFKLYVERSPGFAELELRYDYNDSTEPDPTQRDKTNHIFWKIVQV